MAIKIVEVGPRDGLQNQPVILPADIRAAWINKLYEAGLRSVEVGSVVRADRIPQMANSEEVFELINPPKGVDVGVLVPNLKGLERITNPKVNDIGVFTAASNTFNQKNINTDIAGSLERIQPVVEQSLARGLKVRGTVSCIAACPYEGVTDIATIVSVCEALYTMGCYEIVLGDTIGAGTPARIREVINALTPSIDVSKIALHAHDTHDNAIDNVAAALELGVSSIDAAAAGMGGCPYAPGAKGNVSTMKVVHFCHQQGLDTGVDEGMLSIAEQFILRAIDQFS